MLCIDENKLKSECKYENPIGGGKHDPNVGNLFPHIYGTVNISAVIKIVDFFIKRKWLICAGRQD